MPRVYAATSVYRRLLDERRNATEEELEMLKNAFSRGSNDGYFTGRYKNMSSSPVISGASVPDGGAISEMIRKRTLANDRAVPLTAVFRMKKGIPSSLTLSSGETSVTVCGSVPEEASGHPMGAEQVSKNLLRFGGSGYSLSAEDTVFDIDSGLWMPVSEINSLRRNAVSALTDARPASSPQGSAPCAVTADAAVRSVHEKHSLSSTCEICDTERFLSSAGRLGRFMDRFDTVFVPFAEKTGLPEAFGPYADGKIGITLPVIEPDDGYVGRLLGSASSLGIGKALCHTPGQVLAASEKGFEVTASYRTNVTNTRAHGYYAGLGADTVILSPELPAGAVRKIAGDSTAGTGCVVYGRLPVMALSRCLLCRGNCVKGNTGGRNRDASPRICRGILKDRKNESFPVISSTGCVNVIYNSTPVWMGDMLGTLLRPHGRQSFHYIFTDETCAEALSAIEKYDAGQKGAGRRV